MVLNPFTNINSSRAYDQEGLRRQRAVRLCYSQADIQRALTIAYKDQVALSVIQIAANIVLSSPITIEGPSTFKGVIFTGSNQFSISNHNPQTSIFIINSNCTLQDLKIQANSVDSVINVAAGTLQFLATSLDITTTDCGNVFNFEPGFNLTSSVDNLTVTDDGTLDAVFGATASNGWSANNLKLTGVTNLIAPGFYQALRLSNIFSQDFGVCALETGLSFCSLNQLTNISPVVISSGHNTFTGLSFPNGDGYLQSTGNNQFLGVTGYDPILIGPGDVLTSDGDVDNNQAVVLGVGYSYGDTNTKGNIGDPTTVGHVDQRLSRVNTTSAITDTLDSIEILTNSSYMLECDVVGHQYGSTNQTNCYKLLCSVKNNGGVLTLGQITTISNEEVTAWSATLDTSGTSVRIRVTGAAATNIAWTSDSKVTRIGA